jgi:hypothetical protein
MVDNRSEKPMRNGVAMGYTYVEKSALQTARGVL